MVTAAKRRPRKKGGATPPAGDDGAAGDALPAAPPEGWQAAAAAGLVGYAAPPGLMATMLAEIAAPVAQRGELIFARPQTRPVYFTRNTWPAVEALPVASVKDAARQLRRRQRNWWLTPTGHYQRAKLIAGHLPQVSAKPLTFPQAAPQAPLGAWTLAAPDLVLAAPDATSPFPGGEARFVEDKAGPPNRAYLKLWEALARLGTWPGPGESVLDLGASPGGWTWALAELGARVTAVDKAPLAAAVRDRRAVTEHLTSAFALDPHRDGPVDWLVGDIACYPGRLLKLVRRWLAAEAARHIVLTVKFQHPTDFAAVDAFAALPGARLVHLSQNKHELTLMIAPTG